MREAVRRGVRHGVSEHHEVRPRAIAALDLDSVQIVGYPARVSPDPAQDPALDPAQRLRSHGLHVTAQRVAVLEAVRGMPHATAEQILDVVRRRLGTVSKQAVYDVLLVLSQHDVIRRIQPARSPARFEDRVGDNHHHLVCRRCDRTVDVDCAVGERPCLELDDEHGFLVDEAEVIYWGLCPDCLADPARSHPNTPVQRRSR